MVKYSKYPNPSKESFVEGIKERAQFARFEGVKDSECDPRLSVEAWANTEGETEYDQEN